jgi:hypothetical protein
VKKVTQIGTAKSIGKLKKLINSIDMPDKTSLEHDGDGVEVNVYTCLLTKKKTIEISVV